MRVPVFYCMYFPHGKRLFDVFASLLGLCLTWPLWVTTAIALAASGHRPVLLIQQRAGKNGAPFALYKFRTMTDQRDHTGELLPDSERLTRVGSVIRSLSLDELPQLLNILKGDMSLVGPRPLLLEYVPLYSDEQRKRLSVTPGLTGLAQVSGRNSLSWEQKFTLDVQYTKSITLLGDLTLLIRTVVQLFSPRGVNSKPGDTMPRFTGSAPTAIQHPTKDSHA